MTKEICKHHCVGTCSTALEVKDVQVIIDKYDMKELMVEFEDGIKLSFDESWKKQFLKAKKEKYLCHISYHLCITGK